MVGLIEDFEDFEDFSTVVMFITEAVFFGVPLTVSSLVGCVLVGFVVLSITFERNK